MATSEETSDPVVEIDDNIGRNLKSTRERRGLSQAELARIVTDAGVRGFHQTTIARIENGQRALRASEAIALSRVLGVSIEWLGDSPGNSTLRSHSRSIREAAREFDDAVSRLIHARLLAAQHLDEILPYDAEGMAPQDEVLKSGVDPQLYDALEERIVSASPMERIETAYFNVGLGGGALSYSRRGGSPHKQRVEFLLDEYQLKDEEEVVDGEHPAEA